MSKEVPPPFPLALRDQTNIELRNIGITDSNARYVLRRLIAAAYAEGFNDGHSFAYWNAVEDKQVKEDLGG